MLALLLALQLVNSLLHLQFHQVASQIDATEYAALRVVRNSLQDLPGSSFFSTWDFTLDPCSSFRGVVCTSPDESPDSNQHVLMLSLGSGFAGSPGLTGHLSPAIGSLSHLRVLTLVPGSVRGAIPSEIGSISGLEFLGISKNSLTGSIPVSFGGLTSLQGLDLNNNKLSGVIPPAIFTLPSLMMVILSSNELTGGVPAVVSSPLQRLSLDRNQISGAIPRELPEGTLAHLDLSRNSFSGSITSTALLSRLTFLDLSFNQLTGPVPGSLFTLLELADLLLQRNRLSGSINPLGPVKINRVDLSHNFFTGSPSPLLGTARSLFLNNNKLSGDVPRELLVAMAAGDMQNLYLQHNFLRGIQELELLPQFLPGTCVFCIQYNCLEPPSQSSCPSSTGKEPSRPDYQCSNIEGDWD